MERPRLVASDVDGTLLDPMERVTGRTARVIARVVASNTPFVLVSGRPPRWITPVAALADLDGYAVCSNGAVLYDLGADRVVSVHGLDPVLLRDVTHALERALPGIRVATERASTSVTEIEPFATEPGYSNPWGDLEHNLATRAEVLGHPATKLLVRHPSMTSEEMAAAAREVLDHEVDVTFSTNQGLIELSAHGVTKAFGCRRCASGSRCPPAVWLPSVTCPTTWRCCAGRGTGWRWPTRTPACSRPPTRSPRRTPRTAWPRFWNAGSSRRLRGWSGDR